MCLIIIIFLDSFERRFKLSYVDSCGPHVAVNILRKVLKIIVWILALLQITPKLIIPSLYFLVFLSCLGDFSLLCLDMEGILLFQFINLLLLGNTLFGFLLNFGIFLQPIRKVLDWISRFLSAGDSKTFWKNKTNIISFIVVSLWMLHLYAFIHRLQFG